jgi:hypothetical protein
MIELGVWDGFGNDAPDDHVSKAVRACCRERVVDGFDYDDCMEEARHGSGVCADATKDAGANDAQADSAAR